MAKQQVEDSRATWTLTRVIVAYALCVCTVQAQNPADNELSANGDGPSSDDPKFEGLHECPQGTDEEINECLKLLIEDLRPFFAKGVPQFGLPAFEPLRMSDTPMKILSMDVMVRNIAIHGYSKFDAFQSTINSRKKTNDFYLAWKHLRIVFDYEVTGGNLLFIPVKGAKGTMEVEVYNYNINSTMVLEPGKNEWLITDYSQHHDHMDRILVNIPALTRPGARSSIANFLLTFFNNNAVWLYSAFVRPYVQQIKRNYVLSTGGVKVPAVVATPSDSNPNFRWGY